LHRHIGGPLVNLPDSAIPVDYELTQDDLVDLLDQLSTGTVPEDNEQL
jgi:hypothetical protein